MGRLVLTTASRAGELLQTLLRLLSILEYRIVSLVLKNKAWFSFYVMEEF